MNQRDVVQNRYPGFSQKGFRRGLEEIPVLRAKNISFANDRCLHDDSVIHIANRREQKGIWIYDLSGLAQEADVIVDTLLRQAVERQHTRIAKDFGQFVDYLVGEQQNVIGLDDSKQQIAGKPFGASVSSNEDRGVEDDSQ